MLLRLNVSGGKTSYEGFEAESKTPSLWFCNVFIIVKSNNQDIPRKTQRA